MSLTFLMLQNCPTQKLNQTQSPLQPTLRRKSLRRLKKAVDYKGMFALFGQESEVDLKSTARIFKADSCFLSTLDMERKGFK